MITLTITLDHALATPGTSTGSTTCVGTWATKPTAGSKVIVVVVWNSSFASLSSVKDNGSTQSTFTQDAIATDATNGYSVAIYRADSIHQPSSGSYAITATFNNTTYGWIGGASYLGAATGAPTHTGTDSGTGTSLGTGSATPDGSGALAVGGVESAYGTSGAVTTSTPGWTSFGYNSNANDFLTCAGGYDIASGGPAAMSSTWTYANSAAWRGVIAVYDAPVVAASAVPYLISQNSGLF